MGALVVPEMKDLYPLRPDDNVRALVQEVVSWEKDPTTGRSVIERALTKEERGTLVRRQAQLADALAPSDRQSRKLGLIISAMLMGFNPRMSERDAQALVSQYVTVLGGLPIWAVERACLRFSRGEIKVDEMEGVNRAFGPTTAQLYPVARAFADDFYAEQYGIGRALIGVVRYEPTEEQRAALGAQFCQLVDDLARWSKEREQAEHRADKEGRTERAKRLTERFIEREWASDGGKTGPRPVGALLVSKSLMANVQAPSGKSARP